MEDCLASSNSTPGKKSVLSHTAKSPKELAKRFLSALEKKDEGALWALRVNESEYKEIIWLPYEAKGYGASDLPWFINQMDAKKTIARALEDFGGRKLKLVKVNFAKGEDKPVGHFKIWRDFRIIVKDEKGEELELDYINTVVEINGRYKVVAYHS